MWTLIVQPSQLNSLRDFHLEKAIIICDDKHCVMSSTDQTSLSVS